MKSWVFYLLFTTVFVLVGWFANTAYHLPRSSNNPIAQARPTPLAKYSIEALAGTNFTPSNIEIGKVLKTDPKFTSYEFSFKFTPDLSGNTKNVTGLINIPNGIGPFPTVVMFRGYVDQKKYVVGEGTQRAAEVFAKNGYVTIAPDFLGYGNSDPEAGNIFESRFQTYVTAATLLKSVDSIDNWDKKNVFIWGHSNGGQIALTVLEITGSEFPTVLWAPVSKPFPFSILAYTDESDDHGKLIRDELSRFEEDYDVEKFSLTNYLDRIKAPVQLNQGTNDDAVPTNWSDTLSKILKKNGNDITYIKYPGANHNLQPSWNQAVLTNINFFNKMSK